MPVVFTKSVNAGSEAGNAESNRRRRPSRDVGAACRSARTCKDGGTGANRELDPAPPDHVET